MTAERQRGEIAMFVGRYLPFDTDLNVMREAEKMLGNGRLEIFQRNLEEIIMAAEIDWTTGKVSTWHTADRFIWHATAAQRAEAFLKTIGKWK